MHHQTADPKAYASVFLFFALPYFLFFNYLAAAQVAHFVLLQMHKPTQS
jgi:hypothetical protein